MTWNKNSNYWRLKLKFIDSAIVEEVKTQNRVLKSTERDLERDRNALEREEKKLVC